LAIPISHISFLNVQKKRIRSCFSTPPITTAPSVRRAKKPKRRDRTRTSFSCLDLGKGERVVPRRRIE
jgi:hypothetical protein